jgi:hypothetical protein
MGCRILTARDGHAVFYCSTTGWAFGPVMPSEEVAEDFYHWLYVDPRTITPESELEKKWSEYCSLAHDDNDEWYPLVTTPKVVR